MLEKSKVRIGVTAGAPTASRKASDGLGGLGGGAEQTMHVQSRLEATPTAILAVGVVSNSFGNCDEAKDQDCLRIDGTIAENV